MRYDPASAAGAKRDLAPAASCRFPGVRRGLLFPLEMGQKQAGATARLCDCVVGCGE